MVSFGFHILLKNNDTAEKYRQYHQNVWPEVGGPGGALEQIGVKKMRIFFTDPLRLFMYVEAVDGFDPETGFNPAVKIDPRVQEWCDIMNEQLLERLNPHDGELVWKLMDDIYNFDVANH
ncbi:MAG: L-rhamnose mutarotase [Legionellaceae bacterium]|nr:L-rhamnose mutarotase [Legionellaceae bacterium]